MAYVKVDVLNHTYVTVYCMELQELARDYDKFIMRFYQNGVHLFSSVPYTPTSTRHDFGLYFYNPDHLGNNYFTPGCSYQVQVDAYYNGVAYKVGPESFSTPAVSPPSGAISPSVYPTVKNQGSNGNCVAMCLSAAMELFKARAMGASSSYENFSVSYIFGSDGGSYGSNGMGFEHAVQLCSSYGSPRWELVTTAFPDSLSKARSIDLFNGACGLAQNNAQRQAFTGYENIDFYDCEAVASAIRNHGYFMMNLRVPNNLYSIPSSGIVPQPSGGYSGENHALALIGLTTLNGKKHWIAQNSWGTGWGAGGRCYIPYDWGCGVQAPSGINMASWTCECYSVWNSSVSTANPSAPTILSGDIQSSTSVSLSWRNPTSGAGTLIYMRQRGTTDWWPKPAYGSPFMGSGGTVSISDASMEYEVMAIANYNNLLSPQSAIYIVGGRVRPGNWSWYSAIGAGQAINLSAVEWNAFCRRINEFRQYKGLSDYGAFVAAYSGGEISANICKHAVWAISAMNPPTAPPNTPAAGSTLISASFFNGLRAALNSIP